MIESKNKLKLIVGRPAQNTIIKDRHYDKYTFIGTIIRTQPIIQFKTMR